ncbi:MAG: DUF177 domain-containing protein [Alphaproteobacteria bacterium]|nr:DUF177 domain-containing protein [Alphaproteobacteria bacterium]
MKKDRQVLLAAEWSHLVPADDIGDTPFRIAIEADEEARRAVARRLGLLGLDVLKADLSLVRTDDHRIVHVTGRLSATVQQACVVTLEPVESTLEELVEGWFADPGQAVSFARERRDRLRVKAGIDVPILEEREDPEPMVGGMVDVGELVVQNLSLALPQYPHREGAAFETSDDAPAAQEPSPVRKNPFEALRHWKARQGRTDDA